MNAWRMLYRGCKMQYFFFPGKKTLHNGVVRAREHSRGRGRINKACSPLTPGRRIKGNIFPWHVNSIKTKQGVVGDYQIRQWIAWPYIQPIAILVPLLVCCWAKTEPSMTKKFNRTMNKNHGNPKGKRLHTGYETRYPILGLWEC